LLEIARRPGTITVVTNEEPLYVDSALLQGAEARCRERLLRDPDDRQTLRSMGMVCRKLGQLDEAAAVFAQLARLDPDDEQTAYLDALFSGQAWPAVPEGRIPAPFAFIRNAFPRDVHQALLPLLLSAEDQLGAAMVGDGKYKPETRESLELPNPLQWDVMKCCRRILRNLLPELQPRLNIPPFAIDYLEFNVRVYRTGHYFRTHQDAPEGVPAAARRLSYVYFFHKMPRSFSGGDLVLFDTDTRANEFTASAFTRIAPEDNALVVFPSRYYHCVVPLLCQTDDLINSRFVINGHVCERPAEPAESE
jgi:hypothetical protein